MDAAVLMAVVLVVIMRSILLLLYNGQWPWLQIGPMTKA
jgi:hypothetical protein